MNVHILRQLCTQNPELPADVFTACLTTPIKVALRWFCSRSLLRHDGITKDLIDQIPGRQASVGCSLSVDVLNVSVSLEHLTRAYLPSSAHMTLHLKPCVVQTDRKTPLGELNWIFTAITDTIAWNALPKPLFQKLFRSVRLEMFCFWPKCVFEIAAGIDKKACATSFISHRDTADTSACNTCHAQDLLVASLFRNFLLAERIMTAANCNPVSFPRLPPTHNHPMWQVRVGDAEESSGVCGCLLLCKFQEKSVPCTI